MANNQTPDKGARSTQLLNYSNSNAVAWVCIPAGPCFQAGDRDQTLGLRSVVPLASSSFTSKSHPIMPRCEALLLLPIQSTAFPCYRQLRRTAFNNCSPNRSQTRISAPARRNKPKTVENLWNESGASGLNREERSMPAEDKGNPTARHKVLSDSKALHLNVFTLQSQRASLNVAPN
jgi:hypothetical protein